MHKKKVSKKAGKAFPVVGSEIKIEIPAKTVSIDIPKIVEKAAYSSGVVSHIEYDLCNKLELWFQRIGKKISNNVFEEMKSEIEEAVRKAAKEKVGILMKVIPKTMYINLGDVDSDI